MTDQANPKTAQKRHIDMLSNGVLTDEMVIDWYTKCQPVGASSSGMRLLCIALEDIAISRGISLPPPAGVREI